MRAMGRVTRVVGLTIESAGPAASVGGGWLLGGRDGRICRSEVVGFHGSRILTMPVDRVDSIRLGDAVVALGSAPGVHVGEHLLGRVLDSLGASVDGGGPVARGEWRPLQA